MTSNQTKFEQVDSDVTLHYLQCLFKLHSKPGDSPSLPVPSNALVAPICHSGQYLNTNILDIYSSSYTTVADAAVVQHNISVIYAKKKHAVPMVSSFSLTHSLHNNSLQGLIHLKSFSPSHPLLSFSFRHRLSEICSWIYPKVASIWKLSVDSDQNFTNGFHFIKESDWRPLIKWKLCSLI